MTQTGKPQEKKLALIGCALITLGLAPFEDESWEIWASGQMQPPVKRWDKWFELHNIAGLANNFQFHRDWLKEQTKPVFVMKEVTDYTPSGVLIPHELYIKKYGGEWLTSTIAWMFAHAIEQGCYTEIGLWGIDMASDEEYAYQRAGVMRMIEHAEAAGIKVFIPPESELSNVKDPYPFCQETPIAKWLIAQEKEITRRRAGMAQSIRQLEKETFAQDGALEIIRHLQRHTHWET